MLTPISLLSSHLQARLPRRQEGASAVEYALIVGILGVLIVVAFQLLGGSISGVFDYIAGVLDGAGG